MNSQNKKTPIITWIVAVVAAVVLIRLCNRSNNTSSNDVDNTTDTTMIDTSSTAINAIIGKTESERAAWKAKDEKTIKELSPFFIKKSDEFEGVVWYTPNNAPKYVNYNGIYLYFQTRNGIASNLRLKIQYAADDWIFWETIKFSIDGSVYEYTPTKVDTDNGSGEIWEWSDEQITLNDQSLLDALVNAKSAKMRFEGRQYYKVKTVTDKQIASLKRAYRLYKALGGSI